jgi:Trypsin
VKAIAVVAALFATVVLAAPAGAVDNGVPDGDRHPGVGLLGFDSDGEGAAPPNFLCTGSVLSHRVFVTAAHCIDVFDDTVQWVAALDPGSPADPVFEPGFVFDDFPFPVYAPVHRPIATVVHPSFDPDTLAHDVAVLVFARRTFHVRPIELPRPHLLDRLARWKRHLRFTLVGYGADPDYSGAEPRYRVGGFRQTATAPFRALTEGQLHLQGAPESGLGGLCLGDSGSPQLLGWSNVAVAQLSAVGETCTEIVAQRLDTPEERRFLARFAKLR